MAFNAYGNDKAGIIFYSPSNFETRLRLVGDLVAFTLAGNETLASRWATIKGRIQRKQGVRNAIAHGSLINSGNRMLLTPAFGDRLRWQGGRGKTGMKGTDIQQFAAAVWHLSGIMVHYNRALARYLGAPSYYQPDLGETYSELVRELDNQIQARSNQNPNSPESGSRA